MAAQSWLDRVTVNIILDPPAIVQASFGTTCLMHAGYTGSDVFRTYSSSSAVDADGDLTAALKVILKAGLAQASKPDKVMVAKLTGSNYATSIATLLAATDAFYGFSIETHVVSDIVAAAGALVGYKKLFGFQNGNTDWISAGVPSAFAGLVGRDDVFGIYHDDTAAVPAFLQLCDRMAFPLSEKSPGFTSKVTGVPQYTTALTDTQKGHALTNYINCGMPYAEVSDFFVFNGVSLNNTPLYERVTADYFASRLKDRIVALRAKKSLNGLKIPLTGYGQAMVMAEINAQVREAEQAGHLVEGQANINPVALDSDDLNLRRMRFSGSHQVEGDAIDFTFTFNFQRDPVISE
jgi:hypothetical protein